MPRVKGASVETIERDNPECPKCGGKLTRLDSKKDQIRIVYKCKPCGINWKTKKHITEQRDSIKLCPHPKNDPPWIYEAMLPALEAFVDETGMKRHDLALGLLAFIDIPPTPEEEPYILEPIRLDEAIEKLVTEEDRKRILRYVFCAAMLYDNPMYNLQMTYGEVQHEVIYPKLTPTGHNAKRKKKIKPKSPS